MPDTGLLSLDELAGQARTIVDAVKIPVIADAEGGFHDAPNIWRTVQAFERRSTSRTTSARGSTPARRSTCAAPRPPRRASAPPSTRARMPTS
jgi:hypothetical protein